MAFARYVFSFLYTYRSACSHTLSRRLSRHPPPYPLDDVWPPCRQGNGDAAVCCLAAGIVSQGAELQSIYVARQLGST